MRKLFALLICLLWQPAFAAVVATGTSTYASGGADSSFTLTLPATVNVGDLLIVQINFPNASVTVTSPAGWTQLRQDTSSNDRQVIFYRVATGAAQDAGSSITTWSLSGNTRVGAALVGFRSDLGGRTVALGSSNVATGSGTALTASSITANAASTLLRFYGTESGNTTFVLPAGLTLIANAATASVTNGSSLIMASRAIAAAGATVSDTATASQSGNWIAQSLLLTESGTTRPSNCVTDDFSNSSSFANNWVTTSVSGGFGAPRIVSGRLRLTDNTNNVSTAATLQRIFPTSNLIYVEFNHYAYPSSGGADGIAVTLSDATITPQPGGFGGSLGYAPRDGVINGFAGGWLGIALDEYGNYSNPTEGRNGGPGFRADAVAIRGSGAGQAGYAYVAGTAAGLNPGIDAASSSAAPGYRYRIVIDAAAPGQTYVTVDRDTSGSGSSYVNLVPTFNISAASGQSAIPANLMLSLTGSTGGSTNNHEIGNLSVCATTINSATQVDHFEFTHDGQGLTCEPENVTIRACANATCSTLMSVPVTVSLNPSSGWSSNPITFTGSTTVQLQQTTAGTAAISVASSSPGARPFSTNKCNGVSTNTCNLPFADAGLAFDVPNLLANKPSGAVRLRAVRNSGDANNSCVALFQNSTQNISFWSGYTSPSTGSRFVELRAGSGSGAFTNISGSSASPTPLALSFDANGETTFEARYQDAGQMALNARFTGSGTYAGLILNGADSFVSTPAGFCMRGATVAAPTTYTTCTSNFATCPVLATVSNPFTLNIAAVAWQVDGDTDFCTGNGDTPNYAQNSLGLASIFGLTSTQFNAAGAASNGVVTPTTVDIVAGQSGVVTQGNVTESEVGAFTFTVTPPSLAYFGMTVPSGTSAILGRFIPHHFSVTGGGVTNRSSSCAVAPAFTYLGESLGLGYQINAMNNAATPAITQNYQGIFAKLSTYSQTNTAAISVGPPRTALAPQATGTFAINWSNGQGTVTSPVMVPKTATPVGPYATTYFGVVPTDSDGVTTIGLNLDTSAPADSVDRVQIGTSTELRYGRLRFDSEAGPADVNLSMPVVAEYWSGSSFITNVADTNCASPTITTTQATLVSGSYKDNLSSGETALSGNANIVAGIGNGLQLSAPGTSNQGSVDVQIDITAWPWLWYDWSGDGVLDTNVTATASFGTYRGSDRVIYWLEQN